MADKEKLEKEKEVIGFYLSAHPLETYEKQLKWFSFSSLNHIAQLSKEYDGEQELFTVTSGLMKSKKEILTKKGDRMAFVQLEDNEGSAEIILFPKTFAKVSQWLDTYNVFVVKGSIDLTATKGCKILANEFIPAELIFQEWKKIINATFTLPQKIDESLLVTLQNHMTKGTIPTSYRFYENGIKLELRTKKSIALDQNILEQIENMGISVSITL